MSDFLETLKRHNIKIIFSGEGWRVNDETSATMSKYDGKFYYVPKSININSDYGKEFLFKSKDKAILSLEKYYNHLK